MSRRIDPKHLFVDIDQFLDRWLIKLTILTSGVYLGGFVLQEPRGQSQMESPRGMSRFFETRKGGKGNRFVAFPLSPLFLSLIAVLLGIILWSIRHGFHDIGIFVPASGDLIFSLVIYIPLILLVAGYTFLLIRVSFLGRNKYLALVLFSLFAWIFLEFHIPTF